MPVTHNKAQHYQLHRTNGYKLSIQITVTLTDDDHGADDLLVVPV